MNRQTNKGSSNYSSRLNYVKRWCDEIAQQEADEEKFHTVIAVDPDVISMAAFPLDSIALGGVFHDWGPLRAFSNEWKEQQRNRKTNEQLEQLNGLYKSPPLRVAFFTLVALSQFIFSHQRTKEKYIVLPPHRAELGQTENYAKHIANEWKNSLPGNISTDAIKAVIGNTKNLDEAADLLTGKIPEISRLLFPYETRPDYAGRTLFQLRTSGAVIADDGLRKTCSNFKIPDSDPKKWTGSQYDIFQSIKKTWVDLLKEDISHTQTRSNSQTGLDHDADALAWVQYINEELQLEADGKKLRIILLTASAPLFRTAYAVKTLSGTSFGTRYLRCPIGYLGLPNFFQTYLNESDLSSHGDKWPLLTDTGSGGHLGAWLSALLSPSGNRKQQNPDELHSGYVTQWENLISHIGTSLNLNSPRSGLRKSLDASWDSSTSQLSEAIASLVQTRIIDAALGVSKEVNQAGFVDIGVKSDILRNMPPIRFRRYDEARNIVDELIRFNLSKPADRRLLVEKIQNLSIDIAENRNEATTKYFQSILISLVWCKLGEWTLAKNVSGDAVRYAFELSATNKSIHNHLFDEENIADNEEEDEKLTGKEALYLLAVNNRLSSNSEDNLELSHVALKLANDFSENDIDNADSNNSSQDIRFESEEESLAVAQNLYKATSLSHNLHEARLASLIKRLNSERWKKLRDWACSEITDFKEIPDEIGEEQHPYIPTYALQQMYCALVLRYSFVYQATKDRSPYNSGEKISFDQSMVSFLKEYFLFANNCQKAEACGLWVRNSSASSRVRELGLAILRKSIPNVLEEYDINMSDKKSHTSNNHIPPHDTRREKWLKDCVTDKTQ